MNQTLPPDTITLLEGILQTLRETKQDREKSNWLLLRSRQALAETEHSELRKDLDDHLANSGPACAEAETEALIENLL